jgi:Fe-S-cluster containining protein
MSNGEDGSAHPRLTGHVGLELDGSLIEFDVDMPGGPLAVDDLVPLFQGLSSMVVEAAERRTKDAGRPVSCREGCAACCRQAVPVTEGEARRLAALVEAMAEPRRSAVIARFEAAGRALRASELGRRLLDVLDSGVTPPRALVEGYYRLSIDCPFLEDERCIIHPQRPMGCREYVVSSDPAHCFALAGDKIERLKFTSIFERVARVGGRDTALGWLLLLEAISFAATTPPPPRDRPGPDILRAVIESEAPQARRS